MTRRRKEPWSQVKVHKKRKGKRSQYIESVVLGGPPKKITKGVRRQLIKLHYQNPREFERQCELLGIMPKTFERQYIEAKA